MAVVDINAKTAQATAEELNGKGIRSIAVTADITKAKECQRCASCLRPQPAFRLSCARRSMCIHWRGRPGSSNVLLAMTLSDLSAKPA